MYNELAQRADVGRCVHCNRRVVDAWVCQDCAFDSTTYARRFYDDARSSTARKAAKNAQHREHLSMLHEHLIAIQSIKYVNEGIAEDAYNKSFYAAENRDKERIKRAFHREHKINGTEFRAELRASMDAFDIDDGDWQNNHFQF